MSESWFHVQPRTHCLYTFDVRPLRELAIQHISLPNFRGGGGVPMGSSFSEMGTELHKILGGHTSLVGTPTVCVRCQVCCFVSELEPLKVQNKAKFRHI